MEGKPDLSLCLAGIRPQFWKRLYDSALESCRSHSWELGRDHAPIYHAHSVDRKAFYDLYQNPDVRSRVKIYFSNWRLVPSVWERRWGKS